MGAGAGKAAESEPAGHRSLEYTYPWPVPVVRQDLSDFRDGHGPSALDECDFNELRDPAAGLEINILPSDETGA
jgi:hypothetical protein